MPSWRGDKLRGKHETHIDTVTDIAGFLREPALNKLWSGISLGIISAGKGTGGGQRGVKFLNIQGGALLLKARQALTLQEVRIWSENPKELRLALARRLRDERIPISFQPE
jgi:hypothetical protein